MNLDILVSLEKNWNEIQTKDSKNRKKDSIFKEGNQKIRNSKDFSGPTALIKSEGAENPFLP